MQPDSNELPFHPLPNDGEHIRVLSRERGSRADDQRYVLSTISLDHHLPFLALSYRWSDEKASQPIIIDGTPMIVMQTVKDFLDLHLQRQRHKAIFIDSICINQQDLEERASQVKLMAHVYSMASKVCVWLGNDISSRDSRRLRTTTHWRAPLFASGQRRSELARSIFWRQYWSRAWVVQELINARKIQVFWGRAVMTEADLLNIIEHGRPSADKVFLKSMTAIVQRTNLPRFLPLEELLVLFEFASATDVRDKVYALHGMATDARNFPVDYSATKTVAAVFCDAMDYCDRVSKAPHVRVAFARRLSVSLELRRQQIIDEAQAVDRFVRARGWVCCVIDDDGGEVTPSDDEKEVRRFAGLMRRESRFNHPNADTRDLFRRDKYANSALEADMAQSLPSHDPGYDTNYSSPAQMVINVARYDAGEPSSSSHLLLPQPQDVADITVHALPAGHSDLLTRVYACKDTRPKPPPGSSISARSAFQLQPGDVICRFLGVLKALALRVQRGAYVPVGIVTLEGGLLDVDLFRETGGSPLDIEPLMGPSFLFSLNMVAVAELALFG